MREFGRDLALKVPPAVIAGDADRSVHKKARSIGLSGSSPGELAKPTTMSPRRVMAVGVFQVSPPRFPRFFTVPFCQSTACLAVWRPTDWSHVPEMPTT
jgi:hypothetical protein